MDGTPLLSGLSCEKTELLCSRSRPKQRYNISMNVRPDDVFCKAEPFAGKLGTMMHHNKLKCQTERLVYDLQGHGQSQTMTIAIVFTELLNQIKSKQTGQTLIVTL